MVGLLDDVSTFIGGDDATKDEYGMTQADRRMPIWQSLIKMGGLLAAGGQSMMPNERAQYIAQAAGALSEAPGNIAKLRSEGAQQLLRQQQIATAKQKMQGQQAIMALGKDPAFLNASPEDRRRLVLQALIQSGDTDAVQRMVTGEDTAAIAHAKLGIMEERLKLAQQKAEGTGSYKGQALEAQHLENLRTKDPSSFEYWAAYNYFSTPRQLSDGTKMDKQNLQGLPVPTYSDKRPGGGAAAGGGGADPAQPQTPDQIGQGLQPGEERTLDTGVVVRKGTDGAVLIEHPDGSMTRQEPNKPRELIPPAKIDPIDQRKLNDLKTTQAKVKLAKEDFLKEWRNASTADRVRALAGGAGTLTSSWANLAMLVKEAGVFNLGVITGPDLELLQRVVADPSSMRSLGLTPEQVEAMADKVLRINDVGIQEHEKNMLYPVRRKRGAPAPGGGGPVKKWNPQTGQLE